MAPDRIDPAAPTTRPRRKDVCLILLCALVFACGVAAAAGPPAGQAFPSVMLYVGSG